MDLLRAVGRCREGDPEAWRAVLPAVQEVGRRTLRPFRLSGFDSDDVLADALTSLYAGELSRFRGTTLTELIDFLRTVVRNRALELAKARPPSETNHDSAGDHGVEALCREIGWIKRDDRELYLMSARGLREREIAEQVGRPAAAVASQLALVLERLRGRLGTRMDHATGRLVEDLERRAETPASDCVTALDLEHRLAGRLDPSAQARVDGHLEPCLTCLNAFVELRDHLQGLADPAPASPVLRRVLDGLIGEGPRGPREPGTGSRLRRLVTARFPAWAVAGVAASLVVVWGVGHYRSVEAPARLAPVHTQTARTVSGVVGAIRDANANGVEAHVVSVTDSAGTTYLLFVWGPPTVRPGELVEIDAVVASAPDATGRSVYQGVATAVRHAR